MTRTAGSHGARLDRGRARSRGAFSLLEVVVAIGVFAVGIVVVIGLFAPLAKSSGGNADAEHAAHLGDAIKIELAQRVRAAGSFAPVVGLINPHEPKPLFASRDGLVIGEADGAVWQSSGAEKFFEITLIRNARISPEAADSTAAILVYTARIAWPAPGASTGTARAIAPEVLLLSGSIRR